jgi:hypothetical protein
MRSLADAYTLLAFLAIPYLLERYVASGRSLAAFANWLENFRGDVRPEQDIGDYLRTNSVLGPGACRRSGTPQHLNSAMHFRPYGTRHIAVVANDRARRSTRW